MEAICNDGSLLDVDNFDEITNGEQVNYIDYSDSYIKTLDGIEKCINLTVLRCGNNKIKSLIPLQKCVNLKKIYCSFNMIATLKGLENCVELQILYCDNNRLKKIEYLDNCIKLEELCCDNNKLKLLDGLSKCINLQKLLCNKNRLISLNGIRKCTKLIDLSCSDNKLKTFEGLENCIYLTNMTCMTNKYPMSIKELGNCVNLQIFTSWYTTIISLDGLEKCTNLKSFYTDDKRYLSEQQMINCGNNFKITDKLLPYNQLYKTMTMEQMNVYYDYLRKHIDTLLEYNYDNFIKSIFFKYHRKELVKKYNLVEFFDEIFEHQIYTDEVCPICYFQISDKYVKCEYGHIICKDCCELLHSKKCCVCNTEYNIETMYYTIC